MEDGNELESPEVWFADTACGIGASSWAGTSGTEVGAPSEVEVDIRGSFSLSLLLRRWLILRLLRLNILNRDSLGDPFSSPMSAASALLASLLAFRAFSRSAASCLI